MRGYGGDPAIYHSLQKTKYNKELEIDMDG